MKKVFIAFLFCTGFLHVFAQTAYVQVSGEPGLEVYLNDVFKCQTKADLGGCIIENVQPGKNTIRVVKSGYVPFEESITVRPGEVFLYKVKEFSKNSVYVSQSGNTEAANRQMEIETGTLVIQSIPIGIKLSVPDIEDLSVVDKTQDVWKAEHFTTGPHKVVFLYNDKRIEKKITIEDKHETRVFVNMLSGDVQVTNKIEEKYRLEYQHDFLTNLANKYRFKPGLSIEAYVNNDPSSRILLNYPLTTKRNQINSQWIMPFPVQNTNVPCVTELTNYGNGVGTHMVYTVLLTQNKSDALTYYENELDRIKEYFDKDSYRYEEKDGRKVFDFDTYKCKINFRVEFNCISYSNGWYRIYYNFMSLP